MGLTLTLAGCDSAGDEGETDGAGGSGSGGSEGSQSGNDSQTGNDSAASGADSDSDSGGGGEIPANGYCDPVSSWDTSMVEFEEDVLVIVNEVRAAGASCGGQSFAATGPLTMNPALRCAARVHSKDMADRAFFDHTNPDGEDPFVRMERAGYSYFTAGENIAAGQTSPSDVMQGWMDSPGHCRNIMNPDFAEIGVGTFESVDGGYRYLWTQTFGAS